MFLWGQLFCVQKFPKYFFLNSIIKNICAVFSKVCSNGPLTFFTSFSKPGRTSTDSCENSSAASLNDQLDPNICWKVKLAKYCFQIFNLKQFRSLKMGGEVVILANSLISHFQQSLRHSAVNAWLQPKGRYGSLLTRGWLLSNPI